uniref:Uncharacterized protein n=1 Tax=Candidatus Kentrum sp. TUN TaxID=2126343 RepID=A0A451A3B1_9GAMM|nr:MAG: hypothetical protein BECKTUN1418D_GA0071000_11257 [Candidatus Kentron sp. TUN]
MRPRLLLGAGVDLSFDLLGPNPRFHGIHIQEDVVAVMGEFPSDETGEGFPDGVPAIADEYGFWHVGIRLASKNILALHVKTDRITVLLFVDFLFFVHVLVGTL